MKEKTFANNPFGDPKRIKSIPYLIKHVKEMSKFEQRKVSKFIHNLNSFIGNFEYSVSTLKLTYLTKAQFLQILEAMETEYQSRLLQLAIVRDFDQNIVDTLNHFVVTSFKLLAMKFNNFGRFNSNQLILNIKNIKNG